MSTVEIWGKFEYRNPYLYTLKNYRALRAARRFPNIAAWTPS